LSDVSSLDQRKILSLSFYFFSSCDRSWSSLEIFIFLTFEKKKENVEYIFSFAYYFSLCSSQLPAKMPKVNPSNFSDQTPLISTTASVRTRVHAPIHHLHLNVSTKIQAVTRSELRALAQLIEDETRRRRHVKRQALHHQVSELVVENQQINILLDTLFALTLPDLSPETDSRDSVWNSVEDLMGTEVRRGGPAVVSHGGVYDGSDEMSPGCSHNPENKS